MSLLSQTQFDWVGGVEAAISRSTLCLFDQYNRTRQANIVYLAKEKGNEGLVMAGRYFMRAISVKAPR